MCEVGAGSVDISDGRHVAREPRGVLCGVRDRSRRVHQLPILRVHDPGADDFSPDDFSPDHFSPDHFSPNPWTPRYNTQH